MTLGGPVYGGGSSAPVDGTPSSAKNTPSDKTKGKEVLSVPQFTYVGRPPASPGHCYLCHNGNADGYVDTGISNDWDGAVYVCVPCVIEMFAATGLEARARELLPSTVLNEIAGLPAAIQNVRDSYDDRLASIQQLVSGLHDHLQRASDSLVNEVVERGKARKTAAVESTFLGELGQPDSSALPNPGN